MRKTKLIKRISLLPYLRLAPKTGLALIGILVCLGGTSYLASRQTHPASASGLDQILCDFKGGGNGQTCLNRYRGGTAYGTSVIGYFSDYDSNENFQFQLLDHMCNGGFVSAQMSCPFAAGSGLNTRYNGDEVMQIRDASTGKCLGNDYYDPSKAALAPCNNASGSGGGNGTIFVLNIYGGGGTHGYVESRYWSNHYGKPAWLCSISYASDPRPVLTGTTTDFGPYCQWGYVSK